MPWELIQPLDEKSIYARFLAEKGEGVHHLAGTAANYDELLAAEAKRSNDLVLSCELGGQYEGIQEEPPRVVFWYEAGKPQRYRHEARRAA